MPSTSICRASIRTKVIELKLDGTKEAELYRLLLIAQCNALHTAMPFLFEKIDDETELLLPDNLLHSDSLIRKLVNEIDEAGLAGGRDHRLALPVLHLGKEGRSDRQGGQERGHPRRHAAFHAQLDRQVPRPKHAGAAVGGDLPELAACGSRWNTTSSLPNRRRKSRRN